MNLWIGFLLIQFAQAQQVDVKDVAAQEGSTTIEIKKGVSPKAEALWEVQDGESDLEGSTGTSTNKARENWRTACVAWKKEFRQDNKENKIINLSCGTPSCSEEPGNRTCTSKASYKIKTRLN